MKIAGFFSGILDNDTILLKAKSEKDLVLVKKIFKTKSIKEEKFQKEFSLKCEIDLQTQNRTFKQLKTVWKLVTAIYESMEGRKPTESEKYDLYLDLLEEYAEKMPSKINGKMRVVHISESNTLSAAKFIDGLLFHLASFCDLDANTQSDVRQILYDWEIWRGNQSIDINDFRSIDDMRKRIIYSEASGMTGGVDFHHIISRGAYPEGVNKSWNLLALTREEHIFFHAKGYVKFLEKYPHLESRVKRAFKMAGKEFSQE